MHMQVPEQPVRARPHSADCGLRGAPHISGATRGSFRQTQPRVLGLANQPLDQLHVGLRSGMGQGWGIAMGAMGCFQCGVPQRRDSTSPAAAQGSPLGHDAYNIQQQNSSSSGPARGATF